MKRSAVGQGSKGGRFARSAGKLCPFAVLLVLACGGSLPPMEIAFTAETTAFERVPERGAFVCKFTLRLETDSIGEAVMRKGSIIRRAGNKEPTLTTIGRFQLEEWWGSRKIVGPDGRVFHEEWESPEPFLAHISIEYTSAGQSFDPTFLVDCRP